MAARVDSVISNCTGREVFCCMTTVQIKNSRSHLAGALYHCNRLSPKYGPPSGCPECSSAGSLL